MRLISTLAASSMLTAGLAGPAVAGDLQNAELSKGTQVPAKQKVSLYVGLQRPEKKAKRALRRVTDPTGADYRDFYSRKAVAAKFGASAATVKKARRSVGKYGLKLRVDDTGVFARVTGTAAQMRKWVGKPMLEQVVPLSGGTGLVVYTNAKYPRGKTAGIDEFFGRDYLADYTTGGLASANPPYNGEQTGTPKNSCIPGKSPELNAYTYSVNQLRTAYGIDELPASKKVGKATRVAIVAQGDGFSDSALEQLQQCFGLSPVQFERVNVRGLDGDLPEGGEGDLDVQVVQSVLPKGSRVSVVQTTGIDGRDFLTWATVFGLDRRPDVATTSYGMCEVEQIQYRGTDDLSLTESVFLRMGLAGTSVFSAAGDRGSSGCVNNDTGEGSEQLAVNYPSSSPYVTAVGGTRIELTPGNKRANEVVWFGPSVRSDEIPPEKIGGGGGYSDLFDRPWWQPKSMARSAQRVLPDVAAHAAPTPGWPVVTMLGGMDIELLQPIGGTSAATPFTAAAFGVLAASERVKGRDSFGPVQPLLYHLTTTKPSTFYDVQTGNNDVFKQGCCSAKAGYDAASGLGSIRFEKLAKRIPR